MRFIGIDPGKSGGIAVLNERGDAIDTIRMPDTPTGILAFLRTRTYSASGEESRAALEYVRSRPDQASPGMWTFARNYGHCEMALTAAGVPYYDVHPLRWQKLMECRTHGDKNISKARAVELWPGTKITHAIADALLIAEWCRRNTLGLKGNP